MIISEDKIKIYFLDSKCTFKLHGANHFEKKNHSHLASEVLNSMVF